jgi:glycosyltransferase involved in cell wall biosynthesis
MPKLSAIIITKNEEAHIGRALQSMKGVADEVVVVDDESGDHTRDIAKQFTPHVFTRRFDGYGAQKNFARERASGDWILHLDADEEVSPALAREIRRVIKQGDKDFYWLPIITEFLGRPLQHMRGWNLRLFRRTAAQWDEKPVHEQVVRTGTRESTVRLGDPDSTILAEPLTHHSHYQTLAAYRERQERYSSADAQEMASTGRDRSGRPVSVDLRNPVSVTRFLFERAVKQFVRKFLRQRGVLDGWQGWLWCWVSAQYEYKMCKKYLALVRNR